MFRAIAALALASASTHNVAAQNGATLTSTTPWWERVTVTVTDDGKAQACRYESSLQPASGQDCTVDSSSAARAHSASTGGGATVKDAYTRITFERRFSPDVQPAAAALQPGDRLLGGQVMALAIDSRGAVKNCRVVSTSGSVTPQYGCDEAAAERFEASARAAHSPVPAREGYMTILVYGHSEHMV